jgi:putative nucleotidyltransferase with HDIG domain
MAVLNEAVPIRIDKSFEMPSLPLVLTKILQVLDEDKASGREYEELILHDPPLSARILKLANSAFYSFPNEVKTISHAIPLLGLNLVKSLAIGVNIFDSFAKGMKKKAYLVNRLWMHSFGAGLIAQEIWTRRSSKKDGEFAFLCGLLHDIGKVVLFRKDVDFYSHIFEKEKSDSDPDICALEVERYGYGMDHAAIGFLLAKQWSLPPDMATVIRKHHDALNDCSSLVAAVGLADALVKQAHIGYDGDNKTPACFEELQAHLQVHASESESLAAFAALKREEIEKFFQLAH